MNAFEILGLSSHATQQQVHQAYRARAKACHPDQFPEGEQQRQAQEQLLQLNLAYEEALRLTAGPVSGRPVAPSEEIKAIARRLMEQNRYETALMQLARAPYKDDEWYALQGQLLMKIRQYAKAHQSFREAVRLNPDSQEHRALALHAAITVKKHQRLRYRVADWAGALFRSGKKL